VPSITESTVLQPANKTTVINAKILCMIISYPVIPGVVSYPQTARRTA
jgi:hypothetical protein